MILTDIRRKQKRHRVVFLWFCQPVLEAVVQPQKEYECMLCKESEHEEKTRPGLLQTQEHVSSSLAVAARAQRSEYPHKDTLMTWNIWRVGKYEFVS